jgi:hypothetical protein
MTSWKKLFAVTVLETRPAEFQILATETERAISLRLREMAYESDSIAERLEIDNACVALTILSREIMAWKYYEAR